MVIRACLALGMLAAASLPAVLMAQEAVMPAGCAVSAQSGIIRIVVCAQETPARDTLVAAGQAACAGALPCGAWFWTDPAKAPAVAPANHDGLSEAEIEASLGVWVAETQSLIEISAAQ